MSLIKLYTPEIRLLTFARELISQNKNIRIHAGNHSDQFDNIFYQGDNIINITDYTINPYVKNNILTASAGHTLIYLKDYLSLYGLKLRGTPESGYITLGGAVLNGVHHGSSLYDSIAEYVTEMLLIDGTGTVRRLKDSNLFINIGSLGIVFRIKIKCFPAKNMIWKRIIYDNIDKLDINSNTHSIVFSPYSGKMIKADLFESDVPVHKNWKRVIWDLMHSLMYNNIISNLTRGLFYLIPSLGLIVSEHWILEPDDIRDKYNYFESIPFTKVYTQEYSIDIKDLKTVYMELMKLIAEYRKSGTYLSFRFWTRFMKESKNPYSLSYGRDSAIVELTYSKDQPHANLFAKDINNIFIKYDGKPHLGKTIYDISSLKNYDFKILKENMNIYDPKKLFQNDFMKMVFNNSAH